MYACADKKGKKTAVGVREEDARLQLALEALQKP